MIQKVAKTSTFFSRFKTGVKIVVAIETAAFLSSYYVWYRMNRDQDFRRYMHVNFPIVLEGFYKFGEVFDKDALARVRTYDSAVFEAKKRE